MILATEVRRLQELDRYELSNILAQSGYRDMSFNSVNFLGITNSGDFCYSVKYYCSHIGAEDTGKVYVSKSATGDFTAEF